MKKFKQQKIQEGDLRFQTLPVEFCSLLFKLSQNLQREVLVEKIKVSEPLQEQFPEQVKNFINLLEQDHMNFIQVKDRADL